MRLQLAVGAVALTLSATITRLRPRPAHYTPRSRQDSPLHLAASSGDDTGVKALLAQGVPVDLATALAETPMHEAAAAGRASTVATLLERQASVDARNAAGDQPLHLAARHPTVIRQLLSVGASVNVRNVAGDTPLHAAAWAGDPAALTLLIERGAAVDAAGQGGETALEIATLRGHMAAVRCLQAAREGVDPRAGGTSGGRPSATPTRSPSTGRQGPEPAALTPAAPELAAPEPAARTPLPLEAKLLPLRQQPPPADLSGAWAERARGMPPASARLLVHADDPASVPPLPLLLEGST